MRQNKKRVQKKTKKNKNPSIKGSITLVILIGIVILGAIYLVGGVLPHLQQIDTGEQGRVVVIDEEQQDSGTDKEALRLRTIKFKACEERVAVDLLVDNSGSMGGAGKLQGLKDALTLFTEKLPDESIIGMHSFNTKVQEKVPFGTYGDNKTQVKNAINTMNPNDATHTRDAFNVVNSRITAAQQEYPDQEFALIFFSDGIPEATPRDCTPTQCTPDSQSRCFQKNQDPTQDPNIAQIIKDKNVKIYSIALLDSEDTCYNSQLEGLMSSVASSSESYYRTFNPDDLKNIYNQITFQICGSAN